MDLQEIQSRFVLQTETQPIPPLTKPEPVLPGTEAYYARQIKKFILKHFVFKIAGVVSISPEITTDYEFTSYTKTSLGFTIQQLWEQLLGYKIEHYPLVTEAGFDKCYKVFGPLNKAPRMSIINLLKKENTVMYLLTKRGQLKGIRIGTWVPGKFYGVQTKLD